MTSLEKKEMKGKKWKWINARGYTIVFVVIHAVDQLKLKSSQIKIFWLLLNYLTLDIINTSVNNKFHNLYIVKLDVHFIHSPITVTHEIQIYLYIVWLIPKEIVHLSSAEWSSKA